MKKSAAKQLFKPYLVNPCPVKGCEKPVGKLCDTPGVWVHAERMMQVMPPRKPWVVGAMQIDCPFCEKKAGQACVNVFSGRPMKPGEPPHYLRIAKAQEITKRNEEQA